MPLPFKQMPRIQLQLFQNPMPGNRITAVIKKNATCYGKPAMRSKENEPQ